MMQSAGIVVNDVTVTWRNPIEYLHQSHNFRLQRKYRKYHQMY